MENAISNDRARFIDDDPTDEDLLDRRNMARSLAELIAVAPAGSSFRLGIYGGWGEGKTSLMRMMMAVLKEHDIESTLVLPWMSPDSDQLTIDIMDSVAAAVGAKVHANLRRATASAGSSLSQGWSELAASDWKLKLVDKTVGNAIRRSTEAVVDWQSDKLLEAISSYLRNRKLVVFIDDVDRTDPPLVPKLLLNLREALSLPNLFYVVGLSPDVVQEGLRHVHPGYSDAFKFLEKIIEYPFFLPPLAASDCVRFAQAVIPENGIVDRELIASMDSLLPRNPRQLKLFARTLSLLGAQLRRFDRNEITLAAAYLLQLLALEFPREAFRLAAHDADIAWIEKFQVRQIADRITNNRENTQQTAAALATAAAIDDEAKRSRYVDLCSAIGERVELTSTYSVRDMLALAYQPPILTWKEFSELFAQAKVDGASPVLSAWINEVVGVRAAERQRVIFRRSVEFRRRIWEQVTDAETQHEIDDLLSDLDFALEFLETQIDELNGFSGGALTADEWALMHGHLANASRFLKPADLYKPRRERELRMIVRSLDDAPNGLKGQIFLRLQDGTDRLGFFEASPPAYLKAIGDYGRLAKRVFQRSCLVVSRSPRD